MFWKAIEKIQKLFAKNAPKWFEMLEWLIILGLLQYVELKTKSYIILIVYVVSIIFLFMYFISLMLEWMKKIAYFRKLGLFTNFIIGAIAGAICTVFFKEVVLKIITYLNTK